MSLNQAGPPSPITSARLGQAGRQLFMVLGSGSLPYAEVCITSLFQNVGEAVSLTFITDGTDDRARLEDAVGRLSVPGRHTWHVVAKAEVDAVAGSRFEKLPHLAAFRGGHPCWRKVTDPLLLADPGGEVIILDPDVYFPNRFTFEPTPAAGLYLMWQPPHCLLPPETVERALSVPVRLAHHADIGVTQFRNDLDLGWLDDLLGRLGGTAIPRVMHVESILWSALAMRVGGGYLPANQWYCWRNPHWKRVLRGCGVSGLRMMALEPLRRVKCFHAGGRAKWWLRAARDRGVFDPPADILTSRPVVPFEELTPGRYHRGQMVKNAARALGYYSLGGRRPAPGG